MGCKRLKSGYFVQGIVLPAVLFIVSVPVAIDRVTLGMFWTRLRKEQQGVGREEEKRCAKPHTNPPGTPVVKQLVYFRAMRRN